MSKNSSIQKKGDILMTSLLELFCAVDDFSQAFYPVWEGRLLAEKHQTQRWQCRMRPSEIMTILIQF